MIKHVSCLLSTFKRIFYKYYSIVDIIFITISGDFFNDIKNILELITVTFWSISSKNFTKQFFSVKFFIN